MLDELREIAVGLHSAAPAEASEAGLPPALKTLTRHSAVPVRLDVRAGRRPEQGELAACYTVAEALTNTAKQAQATVVEVRRGGEGVLRIAVRHNGRGGATFAMAPAWPASPTGWGRWAANFRCAARPGRAPP